MNGPAPAQALKLADIHLPPSPDWWPPAPGWWLLALLLIVALVAGGRWLWRWRRRRSQQRMIESSLQQLRQQFEQGQAQQAVAGVNRLLRALALMHFPREQTASLTGEQWLEFLDRSGHTREFTRGPGRVLGEGPYRGDPPGDLDAQALLRLTRAWIDSVTKGDDPVKRLYPETARRQRRAA